MKKFLGALVVLAVCGGAVAWWAGQQVGTPYRGFDDEEVFVDIPQGSGVAAIAQRLADAGVVVHPWAFRAAARMAGAERALQAGEYRFAEPATARDVVERLAKGDIYTRSVTFREGLTIWDMADVFAAAGLGTAEDFLREARDPSRIQSLDPDARSLEGYLFPDTYQLPRSAGAKGTVDAMVAGFLRAFDADLRAEASARGMSVREVVTIASLVEKETAHPPERTIVSAVYQNRLRINMGLQCDPTVIYALRLAGQWDGNLTRANMRIDSPYNTYRYAGLPPGPIAAPGRASLEATLRPSDDNYLYFVSRNDGTHVFANTYAEHLRNVQIWQVRFFRNQNQ
ncbi:MAG: endolytic transglycosylase MltG [Acidobacteria bacterium]|nr:endolytic transglycosylase MltG [Acidobacteriota bacterium]